MLRPEVTGKKILRLPEVSARIGRSGGAIYAMMARGDFPRPIPVGLRAVGWLEHEVDAWFEARIAARDEKQK